jgi:hypothetical protein
MPFWWASLNTVCQNDLSRNRFAGTSPDAKSLPCRFVSVAEARIEVARSADILTRIEPAGSPGDL